MSRDNLFGLDVNRIAAGDYVVEGRYEVRQIKTGSWKGWWSIKDREGKYGADMVGSFGEAKRFINRRDNRR